ncbi:MAG: hypothetical protein C3F14_01675 [Deltaproteobacteria bacterium]|nr:MAG: hypothetical protein C3F14_01675 [Deltaproteobacteria bacterium]
MFRGTPVRISTAASLPAGATVEWLVNGTVAQSGGSRSLDTASLRKGDRVQARAAGPGGTSLSQEVSVRNSIPEIRWARFVLGEGTGGSGIAVEAETADADGDNVQLEIAWRKNGEPAGAGNRLGAPVKRGDKIVVTITPFDGEDRGKSATLVREIRNLPPVIEGQEQFQVKENVVTFHVRASDADGDSLAYTVKDAPAGMRIDRATGWVRWETPPGTTGRVPFTVTVSDGSGGEATARFTVTITEQPPARAR